jgi:hypothetical protein
MDFNLDTIVCYVEMNGKLGICDEMSSCINFFDENIRLRFVCWLRLHSFDLSFKGNFCVSGNKGV